MRNLTILGIELTDLTKTVVLNMREQQTFLLHTGMSKVPHSRRIILIYRGREKARPGITNGINTIFHLYASS